MNLIVYLSQPWPWYVAGPLLGLTVPLLFCLGGKHFGLSSNLRHLCAMLPSRNPFFNYDWRKESWNLVFALGIIAGGFIGGFVLRNPEPVAIAATTQADLAQLGVPQDATLVPTSLFSFNALFTLRGFILMVIGGFLVGFGARYAGGCTSGHGITGTAHLQLPSLIALVGFFIGGLLITHLLLPFILRL
jgi:uncharacterized membrane protein YedE/YeeE